MPEITDEQLRYYESTRQIADVANALWNDPQLGPEAKALLKKKMPDLQIPDHDIRTEMNQRFADDKRQRDQEREAERQARDDEYWKTKRAETQKKHSATDEAMKDLEKFMVERNIGDYEVAADYHFPKQPTPSQPTYKDPYWNHGKSDLFKEIAKDPEEWGRSEIIKAIQNDQNRQRNAF